MQNVLKQMRNDPAAPSPSPSITRRGEQLAGRQALPGPGPHPRPFPPENAARLPTASSHVTLLTLAVTTAAAGGAPGSSTTNGRKKLVVNTSPRWSMVSQNSQRTTPRLPGGDALVNAASRVPSQQLYSLATQTGPSSCLSRSLLQGSGPMNSPSC